MKMTKTLLVAALAAAGLAAGAAQAASSHSGHSGRGGGGWSGHGASVGHWGGSRGRWGGGRYWGPGLGVYIGAPLLFGSYYWGSPYWDDYYYPRSTIVYRERIVEPVPSYNEVEVSPAEMAPRSEGAPVQAPAYRNYCESAKAYYPRVTSCPEGWRFEPSR